ncbi:hypothetical protein BDV25DRAFT_140184 [Aspergillus avenaceus]|uniref:Uncharacterized protein n=1 Tax=Aspergillus avenaceus TaxID=36643 RepID=A0A5N6TUM1_ASPAV|nr:hypothetical protein BDV25DRAFT_140184 [Aspergillus avenaceus]
MSGLPHLEGRQHVQHALQCNSVPFVATRQHPRQVAEPQFSRSAADPSSEYTLHRGQALNSKDVATCSQESGAGLSPKCTSPRSQMRPRHTPVTTDPVRRQRAGSQSGGAYNIDRTVDGPHSPSTVAGQKRTATGFIKQSPDTRDRVSLHGERRRSKSIGSSPHGNRIAALSVHLRTRLSYAAAKIEESRRTHSAESKAPLDFFPEHPTLAIEALARLGRDSRGLTEADSPDGTTVSAPDFLLYSPNGSRISPAARSEDSPQNHTPTPTPSLAPPADIISRRRPNPTDPTSQPHTAPRHKRHHSQQSIGISTLRKNSSSETVLVPETPPLRPSFPPYGTQNSSMEQDAIETLLFMSSPGHSAHRSNSQNSQSQSQSHPRTHPTLSRLSTQTSQPDRSDSVLEAQAGDEIDRMLDQMDSDSEEDYPRRK